MAMRSKQAIFCECGFEGGLHCKENDAPFTPGYEDYHLSGFTGGTAQFEGYCKDQDKLLKDLKPQCPECGAVGQVHFGTAS